MFFFPARELLAADAIRHICGYSVFNKYRRSSGNTSAIAIIEDFRSLALAAARTTTMRSFWVFATIILIIESIAPTLRAGPKIRLLWMNESCIGGIRGLLTTGLRLSYTASDSAGACFSDSVWFDYNSQSSYTIPHNCSSSLTRVNLDFEQPEHGGGTCHCVEIVFTNPMATFK